MKTLEQTVLTDTMHGKNLLTKIHQLQEENKELEAKVQDLEEKMVMVLRDRKVSFSPSWPLPKVCSLAEWCFMISKRVSGDHSQLRCTGFAGSY